MIDIKKYLDIRNILIVGLFLAALVLGYMWLFRGSPASREKVKQLVKENKMLEHQRDSLSINIKKRDVQIAELQKKEEKLLKDIAAVEGRIKLAEVTANKSQKQLAELRRELQSTRKKIEELEKNPANRVGDDLLNSLKNKTK